MKRLIIGGNHYEALASLRADGENPREWQIVTRPEHLLGWHGGLYRLVGRWWLNPAVQDALYWGLFQRDNTLLPS